MIGFSGQTARYDMLLFPNQTLQEVIWVSIWLIFIQKSWKNQQTGHGSSSSKSESSIIVVVGFRDESGHCRIDGLIIVKSVNMMNGASSSEGHEQHPSEVSSLFH